MRFCILGVCVWGLCKSSCGLWESQPSVRLCFTVLVELCYFSEILSGTLANDPIKTCITTELTRDYTLRRTPEEHATLSDTVEQNTAENGLDNLQYKHTFMETQAVNRGIFFYRQHWMYILLQEICKFFISILAILLGIWAKGKGIPWRSVSGLPR